MSAESEFFVSHEGILVTVDKNKAGNGTVRRVLQDGPDLPFIIFQEELLGIDPHPNALRGAILGATSGIRPEVSAELMAKANYLIETREAQAYKKQ